MLLHDPLTNAASDFTLLSTDTLHLLLGLAESALILAASNQQALDYQCAIADIKTLLLVREDTAIC